MADQQVTGPGIGKLAGGASAQGASPGAAAPEAASPSGRLSGSPRRTQEDRRAESDRRILSSARRLIARKGSAGTTLAEIGLEAGYSRGLPSERYGSKQALLLELVARTEEAFQAQLATDLGDKTGLAAVEARIDAHLTGALRGAEGVRTLYLLTMESLTVAPELHARVADLARGYRDSFAQHLNEARTAGEVDATLDVQTCATLILAALRGLISQWLIEPGDIDIPTAKAALVSMVRAGTRP